MESSGSTDRPHSGDYFGSPRTRFIFLGTVSLCSILIVVFIFSTGMFYFHLQKETSNLVTLVNTQAQILEHIAISDMDDSPPEGGDSAVGNIRALINSVTGTAAFGETGEFVVGRLVEDELYILTSDTDDDPDDIWISSDLEFGEPMRRALRGESGTMSAIDYRGVPVIAAYRPLSSLKFGLVTKIDRSEAYWVGFRSVAYAAGASIIVALIATLILERNFQHVIQTIHGLVAKIKQSQALAKLGHFEFDPENFLVTWSDEARAILGLAEEDRVTSLQTYYDLIPIDDRSRIKKELSRDDADTAEFDLVHDICTPENSLKTIRLSCMGNSDLGLTPGPIVGTVQDITLQENLRRGLAEERERLRTTFDSIGDAVITVSSDGHVEMMNAEAERLTGQSLGEVFGRKFESKVELVDIDSGKQLQGDLIESSLAGAPTSKTNQVELVRKDGTSIPVAETTAPIRTNTGEHSGAVIVLRDQVAANHHRRIAQLRFDLYEKAPSMGMEAFIRFAVDEIGDLVESPICWFHFIEDNGAKFGAQHWSAKMMERFAECGGTSLNCTLRNGSACAEATTSKKPVLHNDRVTSMCEAGPLRFSDGSKRELVCPVIDSGQVVALIGAANKDIEYTEEDTDLLGELADVTWRIIKEKKADEALRKSEEHLNHLVKNLGSGVIVQDLDGTVTLANPAAEHILGISLERMRDRKYMDGQWKIYGEDGVPLPEAEFPFHRVKAAGEPLHEMRVGFVNQKTGEMRWVECAGCPLLDVDGSMHEILVSFTDVTRTRQEHEAREASEKQFRATFENAPIAIAHVALDGELLRTNPAFDTLEVWADSTSSALLQDIFKNANIDEGLLYSEPILSGAETIYTDEFQEQRLDGQIQWFNCVASLVRNEQGAPEYFVVTLRDITERKEAEAETSLLTSCLEATIDAVVITKPNGIVQWVNPAFERLSEYTYEEVCGSTPSLLNSGKQDDDYYAELWKTISSGQPWRGEFVNRSKSGKEYIVEVSITPVFDNEGIITHYVGVQTDVTRQRSTEQQLRQAQKLEAIGTLAAGIAHDFNNILSSIIGYSDLALQELEAGSRTYEDIEKVKSAGDRAKELVRQILTFSRTQDSKSVLMIPGPVLKEAAKLLEKTLPESIAFHVTVEKSDAKIEIDPTEFHQIVMNLVTNAYHALPNERGRIAVEMKETQISSTKVGTSSSLPPGDYVMLQVEDNGSGIEPSLVDSIFDPFFTTKDVDKGTGLGLSTVHGIVMAHGGTIFVDSLPGKGTKFSIYFPVVEFDDHEESHKEVPEVVASGQRVLIVDDQSEVCDLHKRILESLGFQVTGTTSSSAAVDLVRGSRGEIAFVLSDFSMPMMDGHELARKIWEIDSELPVVICSGRADVMSKLGESSGEMNIHYLAKPIEISKLSEVLTQISRIPNTSMARFQK